MISTSDFEKVWFMYQTDGVPHGISISTFCQQNGIPYNEFEKWYRKTHRSVARVEVTGRPEEEKETAPKQDRPVVCKGKKGIYVSIKTPDNLLIQKGGLSYADLKLLVERLEALC